MSNLKLEVKGLTVIKYVGKTVSGHNCDFEYEPADMEKYIIHCIESNSRCSHRVDICLDESYGECGSGWCTASWGEITFDYHPHNMPWTHKVKKPIFIDIEDTDSDDIKNEVFSYSYVGFDAYYPCGGVGVDLDLFEELPRSINKRPVFVFNGASGLCKSTLASYLSVEIFETDLMDELPDTITADVIVLGNRSGFTIEDIKSRVFGEHELILVNFEKGE